MIIKEPILPRTTWLAINTAVLFVLAGSSLISSPQVQARKQQTGASSAVVERDVWQAPWVFETRGAQRRTLAALKLNVNENSSQIGKIPIRLDDGSLGALSVAAGPCGPNDACTGPRDDCGCFENDSYWIRIADRSGRQIKRLHFWAAYGAFQIVPVDIVDGPGDELLIFRMHARGAPKIGYDIKIWAIDQATPRQLANGEHVAAWLPIRKTTFAVPCVQWKMTFSVNPAMTKPRPLEIRIEVGAMAGCPAAEKTSIVIEELQPREALRFSLATGKYVFPATGLPADR
jgi:hypothetical protein